MKLIVVSILILLFNCAEAQKYLSVDYESTHSSYDLHGVEIYFVCGSDSLFLTKLDEYKFQFDSEWLLSSNDSLNQDVEIIVKTCKRAYSFTKEKRVFLLSNNFMFSFRKFGKFYSKYGRVKDVRFRYEQQEWVNSIVSYKSRRRKK